MATPSKTSKHASSSKPTLPTFTTLSEWHGNATYEDTGETFRDTDFHGYLKKLNVANEPDTEWYEIEPGPAKMRFYEFRENHGILEAPAAIEYRLRAEQERAVEQTVALPPSTISMESTCGTPSRASARHSRAYDLCRKHGQQ